VTAAATEVPAPSRPVILTVDDDPSVSRAVARDLRRQYGENHRVLRAASGAEALDLVLGRVTSSEEDHRNSRSRAFGLAKTLRHLQAVEARHHHVEHDEIGTMGLHRIERRPPRGRSLHLEAMHAEAHGH